MDADRGTVYLLETAKDWLARDFPGYRVSDVDSFLGGVLAELRGGTPPSPAAVRAVTFPLTKWRTGYAPRDVDRLVGELAQLVQRPGSDVDVPLAVRELVDRIMRSLIRGERGTMRQLAGEAQFTTVRLRPAYVMADVDGLLGSVERALSDLAW